jgi:hypothetical protein
LEKFPLWLAFPASRSHWAAIFSKDEGPLPPSTDIYIVVDADSAFVEESIPDGL